MTKSKRIAALLLAIAMLSGCSGETQTTGTTTTALTTAASPEETKKTASTRNALWADSPVLSRTTTETTKSPEELEKESIVPLKINELKDHSVQMTEFTSALILIQYLDYNSRIFNDMKDGSEVWNDLHHYFWSDELRSHIDSTPLPETTYVGKYGCYPSFLDTLFTADNETTHNYDLNNLTGITSDELYSYIDKEIPVAVYVNDAVPMFLIEYPPEIFAENNSQITWKDKECAVLVGHSENYVMLYSTYNKNYYIHEKSVFEDVFKKMGSMAFTISKRSEEEIAQAIAEEYAGYLSDLEESGLSVKEIEEIYNGNDSELLRNITEPNYDYNPLSYMYTDTYEKSALKAVIEMFQSRGYNIGGNITFD